VKGRMSKFKGNGLRPLKERTGKGAKARRARKKQRRLNNKKRLPDG
jgi:hypothetical protein